MQNLLLLACPIGMGLMMWLMMRGNSPKSQASPPETIEALRDEHHRLGEELARLEGEQPPEQIRTVA